MTRAWVLASIAFFAFVVDGHCATATGFHSYQIVLYQPDSVLQARVPSVEALAAYEKRLDKVCTDFFAGAKTRERLDIVVGLKPGKRVRVWFVSSSRAVPENSLAPLRKRLEAVPACNVREGPVAFAIRATIADANILEDKKDYQPPTPMEWRAPIGESPVIVPDGLFRHIWPD
jgi:hypothetical protein